MFDFNKFNVYKVNMNTAIDTKHLLTRREEATLLLVAQGKTVRDAARVLRISRGTAYEYIEAGKTKLHAETLPHAVNLLWAEGYLRRVAAVALFLAIFSPVRQALLDSHDPLLRTTRTSRTRGGRRNSNRRSGQRAGRDTLIFDIDTDTGDLIWPDSEVAA